MHGGDGGARRAVYRRGWRDENTPPPTFERRQNETGGGGRLAVVGGELAVLMSPQSSTISTAACSASCRKSRCRPLTLVSAPPANHVTAARRYARVGSRKTRVASGHVSVASPSSPRRPRTEVRRPVLARALAPILLRKQPRFRCAALFRGRAPSLRLGNHRESHRRRRVTWACGNTAHFARNPSRRRAEMASNGRG
jgi:hypothetical protein